MPTRLAIGVDLGTTQVSVAVCRSGWVESIPIDGGPAITPAYVALTSSKCFVGAPAKTGAAGRHSTPVFDVKRLIGRRFVDDKPEIRSLRDEVKRLPFKVSPGPRGRPTIQGTVEGRRVDLVPEEVYALLLLEVKDAVESYLGFEVTDVVVTVPPHFSECQRQATKDACSIAGLNLLRLLDDPVAAIIGLAWGSPPPAEPQKVLIFDMGGGTTDVSLLTLEGRTIVVKDKLGESFGGKDFDDWIIDTYLQDAKREQGSSQAADLAQDPRVLGELREASRLAKEALSRLGVATIQIPSCPHRCQFTRESFEAGNVRNFGRAKRLVRQCLQRAGGWAKDLDVVKVLGGSAQIPQVQSVIKEALPGQNIEMLPYPGGVVVNGAAVLAASLLPGQTSLEEGFRIVDNSRYRKNVEMANGATLFDFFSQTNSQGLVCSLALKAGDRKQTRVSSQASGGHFQIFEDDADNTALGVLHVNGLPAKTTEIQATFKMDDDGFLAVEACCAGRSTPLMVTIKKPSSLTDEEVTQLGRSGHCRSNRPSQPWEGGASASTSASTATPSSSFSPPSSFSSSASTAKSASPRVEVPTAASITGSRTLDCGVDVVVTGNPGVGKSTLLSCLSGLDFPSGLSWGTGKTTGLKFLKSEKFQGARFADTPGISDVQISEKAAEAFTQAARSSAELGRRLLIIFVLTVESGRIRREDAAIIKTVMQSIVLPDGTSPGPNSYAIVFNKCDFLESAEFKAKGKDLLTKFVALKMPIPTSHIHWVAEDPAMKNAQNYRKDIPDLVNFVFQFPGLKTILRADDITARDLAKGQEELSRYQEKYAELEALLEAARERRREAEQELQDMQRGIERLQEDRRRKQEEARSDARWEMLIDGLYLAGTIAMRAAPLLLL